MSEYSPESAVVHLRGVLFKNVDPVGGVVKKHKPHPITRAACLIDCCPTHLRIRQPDLVYDSEAILDFPCQVRTERRVIHGDT